MLFRENVLIYEVSEEDYLKAVSVTEDKRVGVNDALAYVLMKKVGPRKIYSFDKDFETFEEFELGKSPDIYTQSRKKGG